MNSPATLEAVKQKLAALPGVTNVEVIVTTSVIVTMTDWEKLSRGVVYETEKQLFAEFPDLNVEFQVRGSD